MSKHGQCNPDYALGLMQLTCTGLGCHNLMWSVSVTPKEAGKLAQELKRVMRNWARGISGQEKGRHRVFLGQFDRGWKVSWDTAQVPNQSPISWESSSGLLWSAWIWTHWGYCYVMMGKGERFPLVLRLCSNRSKLSLDYSAGKPSQSVSGCADSEMVLMGWTCSHFRMQSNPRDPQMNRTSNTFTELLFLKTPGQFSIVKAPGIHPSSLSSGPWIYRAEHTG